MATIHVQIDDALIDHLKEALGLSQNTDVIQEALTMINWAAEEKAKGRSILSANPDGSDVVRLAMTCLI